MSFRAFFQDYSGNSLGNTKEERELNLKRIFEQFYTEDGVVNSAMLKPAIKEGTMLGLGKAFFKELIRPQYVCNQRTTFLYETPTFKVVYTIC